MKTLGLIGGMSWESTALYYRLLNRRARERLGGHHSAPLLIWSADFASIADMQAAGDWDGAAEVMVKAARLLEAAGAEALLICANTMHRGADQVQAAVSVPLIHIAEVTAAAVRAAGSKRPLVLATRYTMEDGFYLERLAADGVAAIVPTEPERERLHAIIYDELVQGRAEPESKAAVIAMIERAVAEDGADGVILACTELGLLIARRDVTAPVFDSTRLHARAAMDFALG